MANHQMYHERTKHIDVKLHFIREVVETGAVRVVKIASKDKPADMLTKSLLRGKFERCLNLVNFA